MKKLFIVLLSCLVVNTAHAKIGSALTGAVVGGAVGYAVGSSGNNTPKVTSQQPLPTISGKYSTISCVSLDGYACYIGHTITIPQYVKKAGFNKYHRFVIIPCIETEGVCYWYGDRRPRFIFTIEVE